MSAIVFLLLIAISIGLIYLIHRYFGKSQFYLIAVIYSIVSFLMSFKLIKVFGVNINASVIFSSGLLIILYYFINRYGKSEIKRLIMAIFVSTFVSGCFLMLNTFMIPSIYDNNAPFYQNLVLDNLAIVILYPISLFITLLLSSYCFELLKNEDKNRLIKTLVTIIGLMFIDTFIFIYFSYAILIRFDIAIVIALDNYLVKAIIMVIYILIINKVFKIRKVK